MAPPSPPRRHAFPEHPGALSLTTAAESATTAMRGQRVGDRCPEDYNRLDSDEIGPALSTLVIDAIFFSTQLS